MFIQRTILLVGAMLFLVTAGNALGDPLGGDGVLFGLPEGTTDEDMDIASNGDIYVAMTFQQPVNGNAIVVYRSTDSGSTFEQWGIITSPGTGKTFSQPRLIIAEGVQDRCFVAFTSNNTPGDDTIVVAWEALSSLTANFADRITAMSQAGDSFETPDLVADDDSFDDYYLYLVAVGKDGNGHDIWFGRSTDFGTTWESAYEIAASPSSLGDFRRPSVSHGFDFRVHVAWEYKSPTSAFPSAIRYLRADNDAGGGLSDWGLLWFVTSTTNGYFDSRAKILAAHDTNDVMLTYSRAEYMGENLFLISPVARIATDQGDVGFSTSAENTIQDYASIPHELLRSPTTGDWYVTYGGGGLRIAVADAATPAVWSEHGRFDPVTQVGLAAIYGGSIAMDPTHDDRIALVVESMATTDDAEAIFDAEWHADPGYPILEAGFPVALAAPPASDPALVDLNGDGDLEIIFSDEAGHIRAIQSDGSELPGWPVSVGDLVSCPVAVGRLDLSDELFVVAGTANGLVYVLKADGSFAPGWPIDFETGAPAYVSLGALGGPYPLTVVVASGSLVTYRDFAGRLPNGVGGRDYGETHVATQPCAIGDIDNDGKAEIVYVLENTVYAHERAGSYELSVFSGGPVSAPITLGDIDLDGDLEIAIPTEDGKMYLKEHTGENLPGWPFISTGDTPVGSAAWANVLGSDEPELAFATSAWKVHLVQGNGDQQLGFPVTASLGWFQYASPVIGQVDGFFPDIAIGTRGSEGWAFNVVGNTIAGWPRQLGSPSQRTPAIGDIDQDGFNEMVLLTDDDIQVFDLRSTPLVPSQSWPMAGHDPQRTNCSDCAQDLVSSVDDPTSQAPTRVSFTAPYPNPTSGKSFFRFVVPERAVVSLEVLDIRGRRIRTIERSELDAGPYVMGWDGRDQQQKQVSDGLYFARLRVSGPGVDETLTRKVVLVR